MDALNEIEAIVGRVMRTLVQITAKVKRFATRLLLGATAVCSGSFLLGLASLDGGIRSVWIVLGIVFGAIAIGAALVARWGVGRIDKDVPAIAAEVRGIVAEGKEQGLLIVQEIDRQLHDGEQEQLGESAILVSRRVFGMRDLAGHGLEGAGRLAAAVQSITRLPALALATVAITVVFALLVPIFLLALALG